MTIGMSVVRSTSVIHLGNTTGLFEKQTGLSKTVDIDFLFPPCDMTASCHVVRAPIRAACLFRNHPGLFENESGLFEIGRRSTPTTSGGRDIRASRLLRLDGRLLRLKSRLFALESRLFG